VLQFVFRRRGGLYCTFRSGLWVVVGAVLLLLLLLLLLLPLNPVIDPSSRCRTRLISRSAELDYSRLVVGGKVDQHSPLIAAQACANDVLNAFVNHGTKTLSRVGLEKQRRSSATMRRRKDIRPWGG